MKKYVNLIQQTFEFPTIEFGIDADFNLQFNNVPLMDVIEKYGTPLKLTYLPKIGEHIEHARFLFRNAMKKYNYKGSYTYCYCTKSSHFKFVLDKALEHNVHLETSSAFDIPLIEALYEEGKVNKENYIICNGHKIPQYLKNITNLINNGFVNCTPVLDDLEEINYYIDNVTADSVNLGIRIATDEEPTFSFYTSRLGVRYKDINELYLNKIKPNKKFKLKMLHFFINAGIKDTAYYWSELTRFMFKYCEMQKICPELDSINIGGGMPIQTSLVYDYDYQSMIDEIIENIQWICNKNNVPVPNIFTEFGSYTVGESGAVIYKVINQKQQNDREMWYMIDGSFITQLPDSWGLGQKYIMLPVNNWNNPYTKVNLGGLTCDSADYYNTESHSEDLYMPVFGDDFGDKDQYIGFFHTGAYQESLGGYGGIQHCLIPAPKHILIDLDEDGNLTTELFAEEQGPESMLRVLGYRTPKGTPELLHPKEESENLEKEIKEN